MVRFAFQKVGMTCTFSKAGDAQGVTVLKLSPGKVIRHDKTEDGRTVVVVSYDIGTATPLTRGYILPKTEGMEVGATLKAPEFKEGEKIKVTGVCKGRGFQDAMTRHGFHGGPATHGSRFHRAPGSVGMRAEPGRTPKGKKLPGHYGDRKVSVRNLKVAYWSPEESLLAVVGGVPGARGSAVFI